MRAIQTLAATSLLLALGACDDTATDPDAFEGSFPLVSTNGSPLPAPFDPRTTITIHSGTLEVLPPDRFRVTLRTTSSPGGAESPQEQVFTYALAGDSLVIGGPAGSGGRFADRTVRARLAFPLPPSAGLDVAWHDMVFRR